jgi:Tfp pilus assembly protein PilV
MTRRLDEESRTDAGYILVEVLVAFVIATMTLLSFYSVSARHSQVGRLQNTLSTIQNFAQNRFSLKAAQGPLRAGEASGQIGIVYQWNEDTKLVDRTDGGTGLFQILLRVSDNRVPARNNYLFEYWLVAAIADKQ